MLKLGEKGAIPQIEEDSYAIAPHIPCGFITPDLLRKIADVSEKFNAKCVKITGAARIAIIGLKEEDIDLAWEELGLAKGAAVVSLISTYQLDGNKVPHWVTVTHIDERCLYIHDPDPDDLHPEPMDCQHVPIALEDFQKMSAYGKEKVRMLVLIYNKDTR